MLCEAETPAWENTDTRDFVSFKFNKALFTLCDLESRADRCMTCFGYPLMAPQTIVARQDGMAIAANCTFKNDVKIVTRKGVGACFQTKNTGPM